jgi:fructoselysine transporter
MEQGSVPVRQLNLLQTSAIIIGSVIGSGVFINLPIVAKHAGTPMMSVLIWALGGICWIPQILILAEMGSAYPDQGGPYAYLVKAGSPFLGFLYTWTAFLTSDTPSLTIIGLSAASALVFFFPSLSDPLYSRLFAGALVFLLGALQYRSVKVGGNLQVVLTITKVLPLLLIIVIGFFFLGSGNLSPVAVANTEEGLSKFGMVTAGITATLWAYSGFLNILYMAGEVKNPRKNLPVSLIGSIIFVTVAYTLISLSTSAIVPFESLVAAGGSFVNPFAYVGFLASHAGSFLAIASFISMVGVLNSLIMTQPRLEYALARDGLFFRQFAHLHPKYLTPDYSLIIQCSIAILLFLLGGIENMLGYFSLSYVIQNTLVYGAIFFLRKRSDYEPSYWSPAWRVMAGTSILIQLYIAYGTFLAYPTAGVLASLGLILSGMPVYWYFHRSRFFANPSSS